MKILLAEDTKSKKERISNYLAENINDLEIVSSSSLKETVRKLKTAQSSKSSAAAVQEEAPATRSQRKIPRGGGNIFKRI